jgi:4-amino-4-deoxy-L-arabinose transferase-like glycosyltransferase
MFTSHPWLTSRSTPALVSLLFCIIFAAFGIMNRPFFPVDETRYLTVAWEMWSKSEWILPTLNFEAYHHKPPILFWLIMSAWSAFGVNDKAALIIPYVICFCAAITVARFARALVPTRPYVPLTTTLLFLGSFPILLYGNLLMFDILLIIPAIIGITAVWQYAQTGQGRHILLFGLAVGIGVLAKGPVILLHVLFPVLLMRWWAPATVNREQWAAAFIGAVCIGAVIALAWAVPAAIKGGPEFAYKIFWGQSAGRMKDSFDHDRPFWWYLPFLPLLVMPWMTSPALWRGLKFLKVIPEQSVIRFVLLWITPVFLSFCFISGKQVHYLFPLLPGVFLLMAIALDEVRDDLRRFDFIPPLVMALIFALLPFVGKIFASHFAMVINGMHVEDTFSRVSATISLACGALVILLMVLAVRAQEISKALLVTSCAMLVFMAGFHMEFKRGFYLNYDLQPIANIIQKNPTVPLAFTRNYHGEWGYLARLDRPVTPLAVNELPAWFQKNPKGMAFIRTKDEAEFKPYDVIFRMPFRLTANYAVVVPKGRARFYQK